MTDYQRAVIDAYRVYRPHKLIARDLGKTPAGIRRVLRNLAEQGRLPERHQWPVPRP